jgi:hypothetical protein
MLGSAAVAEIKRYMGFRTDLDDDALELLQLGQRHLEHNWVSRPLPWFLLSERATTSTVADEERVAVPSDFIEEWENDAIWFVDENGGEHPLTKYDADDLRKLQQERSSYNTIEPLTPERPLNYAITGDYWRLFPAPTGIYTLKQIYYQEDTVVALAAENRWLKYAPYVLIGWAGERLASAARDGDALGVFSPMKSSAIAALDVQTRERELANRRMAMGETA